MNILLIDHYGGSPSHGMEYRPYYLAREWVRLGHNVTIAAASYSHLRTVNPECRGLCRTETIDGIRYAWFWTPSYSGNGITRVVNIATFVLQLLLHRGLLAAACRSGVAIASSTYPLDAVAGSVIAGQAGAQLVYEVHDLWPLSLIELAGMSPRNPFIRTMQWAEDFAYRKAACVISVLPLAESHMRERGLAPGKFHYVPNGIDVPGWREAGAALSENHARVLTRLKAEKRFLIGYAGAHGVANALDTIVRSARLLEGSPVTFVLVGQGPQKKSLQDLAAKMCATNVEFLPPVPRAAIPSLLSAMDALVITWRRTSLYNFGVSPNKLMDYMMAGRPIIQGGNLGNDIVADSGCGFSVSPEDPEAIAGAALRMMQLTLAQRAEMGQQGKQYIETHHDYGNLALRFLNALSGGHMNAPIATELSRLGSS
jgi:glycosyltransferase involved in cell wall biosynthesis